MKLPNVFCLLDTEFTAWKGSQENNWSKEGEEKEIIQISAMKIIYKNSRFEILDKFNIFVKPKINTILSDYIMELTGITNEKIKKKGISFNKAIDKLYNFCSHNNKLLNVYSYGNDFHIIENNLILNCYEKNHKFYKWNVNHFDLRKIL